MLSGNQISPFGENMTNLKLASRGERLGAFMIDGAFIWVISFALLVALQIAGANLSDEETMKAIDRGLGKTIALFFYFPICTILWGATPGKKILKLRVVSTTGEKLPIRKII